MSTLTEPNPLSPPPQSQPSLRVRYRVRFAKRDLLRWISHRDLAQLWERIARRAALPLSMTEGFHPKPRIAFPSALALGVESLDEVVELELIENLSAHTLLELLRRDNQPGLTICSVQRLPQRAAKAQLERSDYSVSIVDGVSQAAVQQAIDQLRQQQTVSVQRNKKAVVAHVATQIPRLEVDNGCLAIALAATDAASLRPTDVLELLGFSDWIERGASIIRTRVVLRQEHEPGSEDDIAPCRDAQPSSPQSKGTR